MVATVDSNETKGKTGIPCKKFQSGPCHVMDPQKILILQVTVQRLVGQDCNHRRRQARWDDSGHAVFFCAAPSVLSTAGLRRILAMSLAPHTLTERMGVYLDIWSSGKWTARTCMSGLDYLRRDACSQFCARGRRGMQEFAS